MSELMMEDAPEKIYEAQCPKGHEWMSADLAYTDADCPICKEKLSGRNPDGTFNENWKGGTGRPKGTRLTWQSLAERIAYWRDKPLEEIEAIVTDKLRLKKMITRDVEIIQQIWEAHEKSNASERELLNDREVGKATQRSAIGGDEDGTPIEVTNTVTLKIDSA